MARTASFGEVYVHTCIASGKSYVGQTTAGVRQRWYDQVKTSRDTRRIGFSYPISRAIRKYGNLSFEHQILAGAQSKPELDNLEKIWIILLQTRSDEYGYNLAAGGEGNPGLKHTPEAKEKISAANTGKRLGNKHAAGTVRSAEQKVKDRLQNLGKKFSAEHNEKIRQARLGVPRPDVTAWNNKRWANPAAHERASMLAKAQRKRERDTREKVNG